MCDVKQYSSPAKPCDLIPHRLLGGSCDAERALMGDGSMHGTYALAVAARGTLRGVVWLRHVEVEARCNAWT